MFNTLVCVVNRNNKSKIKNEADYKKKNIQKIHANFFDCNGLYRGKCSKV